VSTGDSDYLVYADGSCLGNPGPGGWGAIVIGPGNAQREMNGFDPLTTNNRMEITAALEGLRATTPGSSVVLRSDSQYVIYTLTKGWKRNKNNDLWKLLDAEAAARRVQFEWVRGHDVDELNNRADELAVMGAKRQLVNAA
jgi:ribonuclease HI